LAVVTFAVCAGALAIGLWAWKQAQSPTPPQINREALDPAIAKAVTQAEERLRRQPRSGEAWGHLGEVLLAHDFDDEARVCFQRAEQLSPRDARWHYFQGVLLVRADMNAALQHLERAATLCSASDEENTAPRLRFAEALFACERLEAATQQFRLVQEVQPDNRRAWFGLGLIAARQGNSDEACRLLEKCLDSPYARKKAATELARESQRRGQTRATDDYLRQAARLPTDQDWPDPFTMEFRTLAVGKKAMLQRVELLEGRGRLKEAVELLRQVGDEYQDYQVFVGLGSDLGKLNDFAGAEAAFRKALQLAPEKMQAYYLLSATLVLSAEASRDKNGQAERYQEAIELGRKGLALKPDHALAHYYVGKALLHLGQRDRGLEELRAAVGCFPEMPDPYLTLGEELAADGHIEQARRTLEQALRLSPEQDKRAREAIARLDSPGGKRP
jgi:tetratricopeptide (TPR) repeat protein